MKADIHPVHRQLILVTTTGFQNGVIRVRFPKGQNFSFRREVQTDCGSQCSWYYVLCL